MLEPFCSKCIYRLEAVRSFQNPKQGYGTDRLDKHHGQSIYIVVTVVVKI